MSKRTVKETDSKPPMTSAKALTASFMGGFTAGVAGDLVLRLQDRKLTIHTFTDQTFIDSCLISGVQQSAKDASKDIVRQSASVRRLQRSNPFLFGAVYSFPMWGLTRLFATPLQNSRKGAKDPFDGLASSFFNEIGYHVCKNGLDEVVAVKVFPQLLPQLPNFATQKAVEACVAGVVGAGCYVLSWPYKTALTGQSLAEAVKASTRNFPKIAVKKLTYTLVRPEFGKLLK